jgi:hypothetical protein
LIHGRDFERHGKLPAVSLTQEKFVMKTDETETARLRRRVSIKEKKKGQHTVKASNFGTHGNSSILF